MLPPEWIDSRKTLYQILNREVIIRSNYIPENRTNGRDVSFHKMNFFKFVFLYVLLVVVVVVVQMHSNPNHSNFFI